MNQPTEQQASQGAAAAQGAHRVREDVEAAGGVAPPVGAAIGGPTSGAGSWSAHQRLGFLIDEDCAFDDDPTEGGWVSPPVIGA